MAATKMVFKKETKHTVVYEATSDDLLVPVESVYVSKLALVHAGYGPGRWPKAIELEVRPLAD